VRSSFGSLCVLNYDISLASDLSLNLITVPALGDLNSQRICRSIKISRKETQILESAEVAYNRLHFDLSLITKP